jgi:hypothetical protein
LIARRRIRARTALLAVVVAVAAMATPGAASAKLVTHKCAPLTIPGAGGGHFTNIVARGVSCKYARTVFIPAVFHSNFPAGWADRVTHPTPTDDRNVWRNGAKEIKFDLTVIL